MLFTLLHAVFLLSLVLLYAGWAIGCLEANVRRARRLGIPIVRVPFDVNGHWWVVVQPLVWKLLSYLPIPWSSYPNIVRFSHRNWNYLEKSSPTEQFGTVWALVSPGGVHVYVSDPDAITDIFARWREFVRPVHKYKVLSIFGTSLFNAPIEEWPRHRKAVAAPFNESIMAFAWEQTISQTRSMLNYWSSHSATGIPDMQRDLRTVTLNVLASSVFRETYDFIGSADLKGNLPPVESFRDALLIVHEYIVHLMVIPYRYLTGPLVPKKLIKIGHAARYLKEVITKIVLKERAAHQDGGSGSGGLVTSLVRAIDHTSKRGVLSMDETIGNIFMINFAGIDTTANVLAFMLMRLAAEPELQDWVYEEIQSISQGRPVQDWEYDDMFPHFKRTFAVFLETLRLYAPVTGVPKMAAAGTHRLKVGEREIMVEGGMDIFPLLTAIQTDPQYWADPLTWNPKRWILHPDASPGLESEELFVPKEGTFFPWSDGVQNCLGKKVSQVEAVAVLAALMATHRICVKRRPGENREEVERRVERCCEDNNFNILLEMNDAGQVGLELVERAKGEM